MAVYISCAYFSCFRGAVADGGGASSAARGAGRHPVAEGAAPSAAVSICRQSIELALLLATPWCGVN